MRSYDYRCPVWTYTCPDGPNGGDVIESPSPPCNNDQPFCAVKNTSLNRVSLINTNHLPAKRGEDTTTTNAHAIITRDGWGSAMNPFYSPENRDAAPLLPYTRGERVWIEESLLPTDEGDLIPVVSLDTGNFFRMSTHHLCFVPDLSRIDEDGAPSYATLAGPIQAVIVNGQAWKIQGYFERAPAQSPHLVLKWKKWRTGCSTGGLREFNVLKDEQERRRVFENQWTHLWIESEACLEEEASRDRCQFELNQLLSVKPKHEEHPHTPASRLTKPILSKQALRMANIPYRPIPRRPSGPGVFPPQSPQTLSSTRALPFPACSTSCEFRDHRSSEQPELAATEGEPAQEAVDSSYQTTSTTQSSNSPVVVNLKIHFDPTTKHVDVSSAQDSSEDYEMV